ncbi:hypothetical protein [uncultured Sulfitobacter sp.]|uniref:hypothetical protein n=1 Tax=uncultured Sulfitobacter sp. TaxID=191468 RepID=UPI0026205226|nr:hypothetical protein [uncultured Sulfitobacter sp.]
MASRFKTQSIKANKTYEVAELADAACVSIPTVRNWLKAGMQKVDDQRPTMIMGFQALEFLKTRKVKGKRPMAKGEFFCMRCKDRREPLGAMADYEQTSATGGRLKAFCAVCECPCNRNISARDLPNILKILDVAIRSSS